MFKSIRKHAGLVKRGVKGLFINKLESTPPIPKELETLTLGFSVKGNPIEAYKIGNGEKAILFASAIHGNEVGTIKTAHHLLNWLNEHQEGYEDFTFWVIPCLNPDGYETALKRPNYLGDGRIGRLNGHGVDLNRNFPTISWRAESDWTHGANYKERTPVFCGLGGASEPEIQALIKLIRTQEIKVWYMFHNKGRDVMGNVNELAQELTKEYSIQSGYRFFSPEEWIDLKQTGTGKEWCDENDVAFIEIEASTRWGADWTIQKPAIIGTLDLLKKAKISSHET
jgi:predicted deacylase